MTFNNLARSRIEKRVNRMKRLFVHLMVTIGFVLTVTWAVDQLGVPQKATDIIPLAVLLFIAHAFWVMYEEGRNYIVQQEMQRAHQAEANLDDKPKRHGPLALDDDGELAELIYEEDSEGEQAVL